MSALPTPKKAKRQFKSSRSQISKRLKRWQRDRKKTRARLKRRFALFQKWLAKRNKILALLGLIISLQIVLASGWYVLYRRTILSFQAVPVVIVENHREVPTHITISSQKISLPVIQVEIDDGIWPVSDTSVSHLATSAYPGERGNIVMYGHNKADVLGKLRSVRVGDTISLTTDLNLQRDYIVSEIKEVKPSDIEVVLPTNYEVLTLYTCTGWLDSRRLVVTAYPTVVN